MWLGIVVMLLGASWMLGNSIREGYLQPVSRREKWHAFGLFVLGILVTGCSVRSHATTVHVPDVDARVRLMVEQAVADEWGVDGSPALLAAQLHQESSWNTHARSASGAEGLAQMMPATGRWLAQTFPQLGGYDPWDPAWSARAAAVYDHWLLLRNPGVGECSSWAFALSAYNGGELLLHREQAQAAAHGRQAKLWFHNTADYRARSLAAWQQNRDYVRRILLVLEPAYVADGWSGQAVCS